MYPQQGQPVEVSLNDFSLRTVGTDHAVNAGSAKLISGTLQKKAVASRDVVESPSPGVLETELEEKGLPEGAVATPVAGYLYFPLAKKAKHAR